MGLFIQPTLPQVTKEQMVKALCVMFKQARSNHKHELMVCVKHVIVQKDVHNIDNADVSVRCMTHIKNYFRTGFMYNFVQLPTTTHVGISIVTCLH